MVLAIAMALSTRLTPAVVRAEFTPGQRRDPLPLDASPSGLEDADGVLAWAVVTFAFASCASAGLTANLVPALAERHVHPSTAAVLGGAFGAMQLPGRLLLTAGRCAAPVHLIVVSLVLQAFGLLAMMLAPSVGWVAAALMVFAAGAVWGRWPDLTSRRPVSACTSPAASMVGSTAGSSWHAPWDRSAPQPWRRIGYGAVIGLLGLIFAALAMAWYRLLDRRNTAVEAASGGGRRRSRSGRPSIRLQDLDRRRQRLGAIRPGLAGGRGVDRLDDIHPAHDMTERGEP